VSDRRPDALLDVGTEAVERGVARPRSWRAASGNAGAASSSARRREDPRRRVALASLGRARGEAERTVRAAGDPTRRDRPQRGGAPASNVARAHASSSRRTSRIVDRGDAARGAELAARHRGAALGAEAARAATPTVEAR
jgi:hypothetical protein